MADKFPIVVCTCELDNGYIFKNFFNFISLRAQPTILFAATKIIARNRTADDQLYGDGYLHGDEINLIWDDNIPPERRMVSLTFDRTRLQSALSKIRKKDTARITIAQLRSQSEPYNFDGTNSSVDFTIYISCGVGGDGREGLKGIPSIRVEPDNTLIKYPSDNKSLLVIPIRQFKSMMDSFSKCKKESVTLKFFTGDEIKGRPGLIITTNATSHSARIFEKFGEIPDEDNKQLFTYPSEKPQDLDINESSIVRMSGTSPIIEIEKMLESYEYNIDADKIIYFIRLASMHNEGNVRIEYEKGCHMIVSHRFGAFGECKLCLHNPHSKFQ